MGILRVLLVFLLICSPVYAYELSDGSGKLLQSLIPCGTGIGDVVCIEDDGSSNPILGFSVITEQAADPTSASSPGTYCATGSGDCFYKSLTGLYNLTTGVYTADEVTYDFSLTITDATGTGSIFTVDGVTATVADSPKTWSGLSSATTAISFAANTTETVACTGTGVPTDFSGTVDASSGDLTGACTVSAAGELLVGNTSAGSSSYTVGPDSVQVMGYTAVASGSLEVGCILAAGTETGRAATLIVYDSAGDIVGESTENTSWTSGTWAQVTFSSGSITSGQVYHIGPFSDAYWALSYDPSTGTPRGVRPAATYPTAPTTISTTSDWYLDGLSVYVSSDAGHTCGTY